MANNTQSSTDHILKDGISKSFGQNSHFIVTEGNPIPNNRLVITFIVLCEVTGFTCEDQKLLDGSSPYPSTLIPGLQFNGYYKGISVGSGEIFCVLDN